MTDYYDMAADAELHHNYLNELIKHIENMAPVTTTMPANTTISDWLMNPASCPDFHDYIESYDDPDFIKRAIKRASKELVITPETPVNLTDILKKLINTPDGLDAQMTDYYDQQTQAEMMAEIENDEYY